MFRELPDRTERGLRHSRWCRICRLRFGVKTSGNGQDDQGAELCGGGEASKCVGQSLEKGLMARGEWKNSGLFGIDKKNADLFASSQEREGRKKMDGWWMENGQYGKARS